MRRGLLASIAVHGLVVAAGATWCRARAPRAPAVPPARVGLVAVAPVTVAPPVADGPRASTGNAPRSGAGRPSRRPGGGRTARTVTIEREAVGSGSGDGSGDGFGSGSGSGAGSGSGSGSGSGDGFGGVARSAIVTTPAATAPVSQARPPRLIWPVRTGEAGAGDTFTARVRVDADGYVAGVRLLGGPRGRRAERAEDAVWTFRYDPARDPDGRAIAATVDQPFVLRR